MKFKRGDRVRHRDSAIGVVRGEFSTTSTPEGYVVDFEGEGLSMQAAATLSIASYDRAEAAVKTLESIGYTHDGGEYWESPVRAITKAEVNAAKKKSDDESWREEYRRRQAAGERFQFRLIGGNWKNPDYGLPSIYGWDFSQRKDQYRPNPTDDWIEWQGGECPVPPDTVVEYAGRSGYMFKNRASDLYWNHGASCDIVRYRVKETA